MDQTNETNPTPEAVEAPPPLGSRAETWRTDAQAFGKKSRLYAVELQKDAVTLARSGFDLARSYVTELGGKVTEAVWKRPASDEEAPTEPQAEGDAETNGAANPPN